MDLIQFLGKVGGLPSRKYISNIYQYTDIFPKLFPLNQLSLGFGSTSLMIPVKRDPLTLESFVIHVDEHEVILILANKSQLAKDMRYGTKPS